MGHAQSLGVGYVHPGHVDAHFMQSMLNVVAMDHRRDTPRILDGGLVIAVGSGPRIAEARNQVVSQFLAQKAEWLLMIDTDMTFSNDMLDKIMDAADAEEFPIVGGLCFGGGRSGIMFPTLYRLRKVENVNESPVQVIEDYPDDAMCEVDATGAAFLLIHRGVLEKMGEVYKDSPYPWFLEGAVYKGTKFGEDWAFCMRAKEAGYKIHVHTGVKIGHVKPMVLDEDAWFAFKEKKAEIGEAGVAQAFKAKIMGGKPTTGRVPTYVVIPQKSKVHLTIDLCKQLYRQGDYEGIYVFDNGSSQPELAKTRTFAEGKKIEVLDAVGKNIHQMWNEGVQRIRKDCDGPCNIAILNNDLRIGPHFLARQTTALRADDTLLAVCPNYDKRKGSGVQYVKGTWGMGGMSGFAFMFKGESFEGDPFDENFKWWYGDDDFALRIMDIGGKVGLVYGATVEHIGGGGQTAKHYPFDEITMQDRERFKEKHHFIERADGVLVREGS